MKWLMAWSAAQADPALKPARANTGEQTARHREGRLVYPTLHGRRSLIVHYLDCTDRVVLRLPSYVEAINYLDGQPVTLEIFDAPSGPGRIEGTAALVPDDAVPEGAAAHLERWPRGVDSRFVVIGTPGPERV